MKNLQKLMEKFEKRNNISTSLILHSDGSGNLVEFWHEDEIKSFSKISELISFLEKGRLKKENGRAVSPIEIIT